MLCSTPDPALLFVVLCASDCGLRSGTIFALTREECAGGKIVTKSKRGRAIQVPLSSSLLHCLMPLSVWPKRDGWTVVEELARKKMNDVKQTMTARYSRWRQACGVQRVVTLHDLRRGLARKLFRVTGDMRKVQSLLGHETMNATFWYLHAQTQFLTEAELDSARKVMEST